MATVSGTGDMKCAYVAEAVNTVSMLHEVKVGVVNMVYDERGDDGDDDVGGARAFILANKLNMVCFVVNTIGDADDVDAVDVWVQVMGKV
jgi:hypothetical protein